VLRGQDPLPPEKIHWGNVSDKLGKNKTGFITFAMKLIYFYGENE